MNKLAYADAKIFKEEFKMAYKNPDTGRIYLSMKMAPICALQQSTVPCIGCKLSQISKKHNVTVKSGMPCQETCELYGDEVAAAFGYEKIDYESDLEDQPNTTNEFTRTMLLECIRNRVDINGNSISYRHGDQIGDRIIIDLDTLYFDSEGTPFAYGKDPNHMDQIPVNYRLDRFKTILK